jgi:hypothetical protein
MRRREDLAKIEVAGLGDVGEIHVRMGCPLFVQKVLQNRFGIDAHEFLAKNTLAWTPKLSWTIAK